MDRDLFIQRLKEAGWSQPKAEFQIYLNPAESQLGRLEDILDHPSGRLLYLLREEGPGEWEFRVRTPETVTYHTVLTSLTPEPVVTALLSL